MDMPSNISPAAQYEDIIGQLGKLSDDISYAFHYSSVTATHLLHVEKEWLESRYHDFLAAIKSVRSILEDPSVKLVFGGCFSSGKSSILNRLLGKKELPTSILPETGVSCFIRRGPNRVARIIDKHGGLKETLSEFDRARLEGFISLSENYNRQDIQDIDRLELEFPSIDMPENVRWIDSPGIGDRIDNNTFSEIMAKELYRQSDVLIWVNSSRTPLKEKEIEVLKDHATSDTPSAILFVYNVWIESDFAPEEWNEVFNDAFFENELKIRNFFDQHSRVLYKNQIHKFSSEVTDRLDNDSYFNRFFRELNKFLTPEKIWVKNYRMKKAKFWAIKNINAASEALEIWNNMAATRKANAEQSFKDLQKELEAVLKEKFNPLIENLEKRKKKCLDRYSYRSHGNKDFENWLSEDLSDIPDVMQALGEKIIDLAQQHLYPYKERAWLEQSPVVLNSFLKSLNVLNENSTKPYPIYQETVMKIDWDAVKKNPLALFNDDAKIVDVDATSYQTKKNIEYGYTRHINLLTNERNEKIKLVNSSSYGIFFQHTADEHAYITQLLQQQLDSLLKIRPTSLQYSKFD